MSKLLCFFGFHKKIICLDGMSKGFAAVCIRPQCKWKKVIKTTEKIMIRYQKQLRGKK